MSKKPSVSVVAVVENKNSIDNETIQGRLRLLTDTLELSAVIRKENDFYVASCPEFDIASQGKNIELNYKNKTGNSHL